MKLKGRCPVQHGWTGTSAEGQSLKEQHHVLLGAGARPHVELWEQEPTSWKRKAGGCIAGSTDMENKGLGFSGLTLPLVAM